MLSPYARLSNWKLSLVALILVIVIPNIICTKQRSYEEQQSAKLENMNNFDVIDVQKENQQRIKNRFSIGRTTRILTSSKVDDNFWLKYLGEDFRNALHFQVGDDNIPRRVPKPAQRQDSMEQQRVPSPPSSSSSSTTEERDQLDSDSTRYQRQQPEFDELPEPTMTNQIYTEEEQENVTQSSSETQLNISNSQNNSTDSLDSKNTTTSLNDQEADNVTEKLLPSNDAETEAKNKTLDTGAYNEQYSITKPYPITYKLKKYKSLRKVQKTKNIKPKKYNPIKSQNKVKLIDPLQKPIVVTLPDSPKNIQEVNGEEVPVVVAMPPIIYHQRAESYPLLQAGLPYLQSFPANTYSSNYGMGLNPSAVHHTYPMQQQQQQQQQQHLPPFHTNMVSSYSASSLPKRPSFIDSYDNAADGWSLEKPHPYQFNRYGRAASAASDESESSAVSSEAKFELNEKFVNEGL